MMPEAMHDQQQVTADVDRVLRLSDLKVAGVLSEEERVLVETLEAHRIGSVLSSEVVAGPGSHPDATSQRLTMNEAQRTAADAILTRHGG